MDDLELAVPLKGDLRRFVALDVACLELDPLSPGDRFVERAGIVRIDVRPIKFHCQVIYRDALDVFESEPLDLMAGWHCCFLLLRLCEILSEVYTQTQVPLAIYPICGRPIIRYFAGLCTNSFPEREKYNSVG